MANMNLVVLCGNLTRDPDLKFIPNGQAVCNFGIAMNRKWKAANGEWKEEATFVNCVTWGKSAEAVGEYMRKGSPALIEGRLQSREWEATDGTKRKVLEVVCDRVQFLGPKREGQANQDVPTGDDDIAF
jgi:single-strand DNA-binding protein